MCERPDRDTLLLRYFEHESAREIAQALGVSGEAARKHVTRAVDPLREFFSRHGVTVGASRLAVRLSKSSGDGWLFEVIDTGLGIPAEEQSDILKPFHQGKCTRHRGGTGLGLAIARRQVELLGGGLKLQSERGVGSRFHFTIPLERA